jgi:DNA-binding GntR family transcriptional regulator
MGDYLCLSRKYYGAKKMYFTPPGESENLKEKAYHLLKNMIFYQEIIPGQKLTYRELSVTLGMSATPVQMALARLEQEGFVELVSNVGYFVKKITHKEVEDLFDIREVLEIHAIKLAIVKRTDKDLKILSNKIAQHKAYVFYLYDRKKLLLGLQVHLQIAEMSGNFEIVKHLQKIYELIYLRSRIECFNPDRMHMSASQHEELFRLIKAKNVEAAQGFLYGHLESAKERFLSTLSQKEIMPLG